MFIVRYLRRILLNRLHIWAKLHLSRSIAKMTTKNLISSNCPPQQHQQIAKSRRETVSATIYQHSACITHSRYRSEMPNNESETEFCPNNVLTFIYAYTPCITHNPSGPTLSSLINCWYFRYNFRIRFFLLFFFFWVFVDCLVLSLSSFRLQSKNCQISAN